jgi:diadenosine tetraphosphate (Ap4A) HIT family hydrolase
MQAKPVKNCYSLEKQQRRNTLEPFLLDERLARDSQSILKLGLCDLRLAHDSRWPWMILVPQRPGMSEIFDLTPLDQAMLTFEQVTVAAALKKVTGATKINTAAIGNVVRQLHVHVVARFEDDPNWPGPIWGHGTAVPHSDETFNTLKTRMLEALQ